MKGVKSIIGLEDFDINRYLFNFFPKKKRSISNTYQEEDQAMDLKV